MQHGIYKCSCGDLISRCRCFSHREVHVIPNGCNKCKTEITQSVKCPHCDVATLQRFSHGYVSTIVVCPKCLINFKATPAVNNVPALRLEAV